VEAEVYAMASLFISLLFLLGLRWEQDMDSLGNRWLLIISLVIGLSFGHFMALLTIPSIGLLLFLSIINSNCQNFIIANVVVISILFVYFRYYH
jgi:hypothetical protein